MKTRLVALSLSIVGIALLALLLADGAQVSDAQSRRKATATLAVGRAPRLPAGGVGAPVALAPELTDADLTPTGLLGEALGNTLPADSGDTSPLQDGETYVLMLEWGSYGTGVGEFDWPSGIAIDATGNLYVADAHNHRIQKFTSAGAYILQWGSYGTGDGQFNNPANVAVDAGGNVYVADHLNHRIQKFTFNGEFITKWGSEGWGDGQFQRPYGLAANTAGDVYVSDVWGHRVEKFTSDGTFRLQWGRWGQGAGQFFEPYGIAIDRAGDVYVVDHINARMQKFTSDGNYLGRWGERGEDDGQFDMPSDVDMDTAGNLFVTDGWNHRVQKFTPEGFFITKWGDHGSGGGQFDIPIGIAVDASSSVYVSDAGNNRIQKFAREGSAFSCGDVTEIPQSECEVLVALHNSTNGSGWTDNSGWLVTNTPCTWHGVTCDSGHITVLNLWGNGLRGSIPPELGSLSGLRQLWLPMNELSGSIPAQLGNLANLQGLVLAENQLSGSIPPELGNLANLTSLALADNQLSGSIPPELGNLADLVGLALDRNYLSGSIPPQLGNLGNLVQLDLHGNQLSGPVPSEFGNLTSLRQLLLNSNQLRGRLPETLTGLGLDVFWFHQTQLCEPGDAAFQEWLAGIPDLRSTGVNCDLNPIVFVHGWQGWPPWGPCEPPNPDSLFEGVDDDLRAAGYHVEYAYLVSSPCHTPPLVENVTPLRIAIASAKVATGQDKQDKVILIAHSMGGLVSRAYIEGPDYDQDVAALFTFGSPHLGVPVDALAYLAGPIPLGVYCAVSQPVACEFSMVGMILFNHDHPTRTTGVTYHAISGDAPFLSRSNLGMLTDALLLGPDDGLVQTSSGTGLSDILDPFVTDEVHSSRFGTRSYFIRDGGQSRSYEECLEPVLVSKESATCVRSGTPQAVVADTPELTARTPFEYGTLLAGQTVTRTLWFEGGPTLLASRWQTGTVAFTLVDPSAQVIDPAYVATHPEVATYEAEATAAMYYFPNASAGRWRLVLEGEDDIPPGGSNYVTFAAFESAVRISGGTDHNWYIPGATVVITASLSGSPASAVVTATILYADDTSETVSLLPQGGGEYQAGYTVLNVPGYAEVRLVATGTTADQIPFERGTSLVFQVSSGSVALSSVYSDAPQPRSANSSLYQALLVTAGIEVTLGGEVGLSADLVDAEGQFVAHTLTIEEIAAGSGSLTLRFDGDDIYASQRSGPYTLTNLLLTDHRGVPLVLAEAEDVYITAAYDYRSFDREKIYLSLGLRNR